MTTTLPHSVESERAVLAAALLEPSLLEVCELAPEEFYLEKHADIWSAMREVAANGGVDLRTVQARLEEEGKLDRVGGLSYLATLDADLPDLGRWESYVGIVQERAQRRRLIALAQRITRDGRDGGDSLTDLLAATERELREISEAAVPSRVVTIGDATFRVLEDLEDQPKGHVLGVSTGLPDLDRVLHGLKRGNLIIVAGRPGMGKTSLALNIAQHVAIREEIPVAVFSFEMATSELATKVLSSEAGIPSTRLVNGYLTEVQYRELIQTQRRIGSAPLYIDDSPRALLHELAARARRLAHDRGVGLVIVDYLQLMHAAGRYGNRNEEVTEITRELKLLAKDLEIPVVALSQLNRKSEHRGADKRPQLSDLRESGAIEQDADAVVFVHREEFYERDDPSKRGLAELIVAKNRNGAPGSVDVAWFGETTTFKSLARDRSAPTSPPPKQQDQEQQDCPF